jgi:hypothetical protein
MSFYSWLMFLADDVKDATKECVGCSAVCWSFITVTRH